MAENVTDESREILAAQFWALPPEAYMGEDLMAAGVDMSTAWAQRARVYGGGPPFKKINRSVKYKKADVIGWLDQHATVTSTSQYTEPQRATSPAVPT